MASDAIHGDSEDRGTAAQKVAFVVGQRACQASENDVHRTDGQVFTAHAELGHDLVVRWAAVGVPAEQEFDDVAVEAVECGVGGGPYRRLGDTRVI